MTPAVANWRGIKGHAVVPLTLVVVGRNDNYSPDFIERLEYVLDWNMRIANEAIFVEWNPPESRTLISPQLARKFKRLKCFIVPPLLHTEVCNNDNLKLMEYHAKNVGIRRAANPWILASNADVLLGLDVRDTIRAGLNEELVYTAERVTPIPASRLCFIIAP